MSKADLLRKAIELLQEANALQQKAIGEGTDVCYEYHTRIEDLVDDMMHDVIDLEARAEEGVL